MKSLLLVWLTLFLNLLSHAQSSIAGRILYQEEPGSFATIVVLQKSDSSLVKGAISDVEGAFKIDLLTDDDYILRISSVGYVDKYLTIKVDKPSTDLGDISMQENAQQLNEVVVQAQRPLFEQKIDRTVINVQSSITASAGSALDILEKSPGVAVDRANNSLALSGKQGVRVMINGKMSRMPPDAVVQMLGGMNAENVQTIELITTPPAKYEAEGDAGIIHIVLKKSEDEGSNGSYALSAGYGRGEKTGASINFNHRRKKLNFFGNYSCRRDDSPQSSSNLRLVDREDGSANQTDTFSDRMPVITTHNAQIGFDYQLNEKVLIGSDFSYFNNKWDMEAVNDILISYNEVFESSINLFTQEINQSNYLVSNVSLSVDLTENSNLSTELDYIRFDSNNPTDYQQIDLDEQGESIGSTEFRSSKETPIATWVPRVDYRLSFDGGVVFEAGLKAALNDLDNEINVENLENGAFVQDPRLSNIAFLNEDIFAGYTSLSFKLSPTLDSKVGLRYEHTITDLDSPSESNTVYLSFGKFFPSVFLNKRINEDNSWVLSYSRRITRPTFRDIAPFVIFLDPNTFSTGNEALLPSTTDAVRAEYSYKDFLIALQVSRDNAAIVRFQPQVDEDSEVQITTSQNLDYRNNLSASLTLPIEITKWWDLQYTVQGFYQKAFINHLEEDVEISQTNFTMNASSSFILPKNWKIELSGFYASSSYFGIMKYRAIGSLNIGVEKKLNDDKGTFRFTATDLLNSRDFRSSALVPEENINIRRVYNLEGQIFNLSFSKNFGNNRLKKIRKKPNSSSEEQKRL